MLRILGHPTAACDGITRRELLRAGSLAAIGLGAGVGSATAGSRRPLAGPAKAVILIDLFGGPSHIDSFDPKPDAPDGIRGEFKTIPTALPGIRVAEHLPLLARRLDRLAVIRSVSHQYNSHNPYGVMTGFDGGQDQTDYFARPTNHPSVPSVCQYFGVGRGTELPGYVMLPAFPGYTQGLRRAGPYGGYLGPKFDPVFSTADAHTGKDTSTDKDFYSPHDHATGRAAIAEARRRPDARRPRPAANASSSNWTPRPPVLDARGHTDRRDAAFDLLLSPKAKHGLRSLAGTAQAPRTLRPRPLRLQRPSRPAAGRGRRHLRHRPHRGEAQRPLGHARATTSTCSSTLLLPFLDRAVSALLDDLTDRGLLESTLVVVTGDMGRTPKVNKNAGRDHWPQCGFCLFAGGGTKPGVVHGTTDKIAAYPSDHPVSAGDLVATVYHLVGVDPEATVPDHTNRPTHISHGGRVVEGVVG